MPTMKTIPKIPPPMKPGDDTSACPIRDVLDCIGDRWSLLTLTTLAGGTLRFTELKRAIGDISQRMLAQTLRTLEREGYVSRKVYATIPPKVEYRLTALGQSLLGELSPLVAWAERNREKVRQSRRAYTPPAAIAAL